MQHYSAKNLRICEKSSTFAVELEEIYGKALF